jgi:hypothetical protein
MILNSRNNYTSSESFRDKFIETLTPGVIKRADFIRWNEIRQKTEAHASLFNFFSQINGNNNIEYIAQITSSLLSADNPIEIIKTSFELLGHNGNKYVSNEDNINIGSLMRENFNEEIAEYLAKLIVELGICNIVNLELEDYFTGVQVGLETHRRKNIGGESFSLIIKEELLALVDYFRNSGHSIELEEQKKIYFVDRVGSKTLDFSLTYGGKILGIEVNFYTASGSKPTEIKRSYTYVNTELENIGVTLVWVTDGIGYESMKRSLKEARDIHKNIYNLSMMQEFFKDDISRFFGFN